ncbi:lipoate-protein ligase B [mine drainage metagenome]|uniref:lipoyl(octanoyl) transferase n=1 Tax=mine drainage metagenome TaxID=410659 RepID=T0ZV64_9ZZZZ
MSAAVVDWGLLPYGEALVRMREVRRERAAQRIPDTLILVRHPPVITVGVQGTGGEALPPGLPVFSVERGGRATYHEPGQWVGYPVVDLSPRGRDVRHFVHDLEEMVVRAVAPLGVRAGRRPGERGVWVAGTRKLASVGIAVEGWVTFHGFALNVDVDLEVFRSFRPCGLDGDVMTSMSRELGRKVALEELHAPLLDAWEGVFGGPVRYAPLVPPALQGSS